MYPIFIPFSYSIRMFISWCVVILMCYVSLAVLSFVYMYFNGCASVFIPIFANQKCVIPFEIALIERMFLYM